MEVGGEILKLLAFIATIPEKVEDNLEQVTSSSAAVHPILLFGLLCSLYLCFLLSARLWRTKSSSLDTTCKMLAKTMNGDHKRCSFYR